MYQVLLQTCNTSYCTLSIGTSTHSRLFSRAIFESNNGTEKVAWPACALYCTLHVICDTRTCTVRSTWYKYHSTQKSSNVIFLDAISSADPNFCFDLLLIYHRGLSNSHQCVYPVLLSFETL